MIPDSGCLCGYLYEGNYFRGPSEPIDSIVIGLIRTDTSGVVALETTDSNGYFMFTDIGCGVYKIVPEIFGKIPDTTALNSFSVCGADTSLTYFIADSTHIYIDQTTRVKKHIKKMRSFKIQKRKIGQSSSVFVIAEIGLNHNGNAAQCAKLIDQAKFADADAVKLQVSDPNESYAKSTSSYKVFKKNSLQENEILSLKKYADKKKIIFFFTAGDFKSFNLVKKFKMPAIKISSGLMTFLSGPLPC